MEKFVKKELKKKKEKKNNFRTWLKKKRKKNCSVLFSCRRNVKCLYISISRHCEIGKSAFVLDAFVFFKGNWYPFFFRLGWPHYQWIHTKKKLSTSMLNQTCTFLSGGECTNYLGTSRFFDVYKSSQQTQKQLLQRSPGHTDQSMLIKQKYGLKVETLC